MPVKTDLSGSIEGSTWSRSVWSISVNTLSHPEYRFGLCPDLKIFLKNEEVGEVGACFSSQSLEITFSMDRPVLALRLGGANAHSARHRRIGSEASMITPAEGPRIRPHKAFLLD